MYCVFYHEQKSFFFTLSFLMYSKCLPANDIMVHIIYKKSTYF
ncbi:hypothetical protein CHCC14821_0287 [Bacillus paralicheniformis]|nr:hypothetical protein CHCC14821_0287 [Bacillus paralicheniformis]